MTGDVFLIKQAEIMSRLLISHETRTGLFEEQSSFWHLLLKHTHCTQSHSGKNTKSFIYFQL